MVEFLFLIGANWIIYSMVRNRSSYQTVWLTRSILFIGSGARVTHKPESLSTCNIFMPQKMRGGWFP
jgi:hypothetical protein